MLPPTLKKFFWDTPVEFMDRNIHKNYIIARILELGDEAAVEWLDHQYSQDDVRKVVLTTRNLSPKSSNYWKLKYHVA